MKKYDLLFICIGWAFISCNESKDVLKNSIKTPAVTPEEFLNLFPEINDDTIHVYSLYDEPDGERFKGKRIDSSFHCFFTFDRNLIYSLQYYDIFSCFKIKLANNKTGLLVRTPSEYNESAIDLFIWDNYNKKIERKKDLADSFGDEGWYFETDAWLIDLNKDMFLDIVVRSKDSNTDIDDTSSEAEITDNLRVYLGDANKFQKTLYPVDTAKFQLFNWDSKFHDEPTPHLDKQESNYEMN